MGKLTREEVLHAAKLAKLDLTPREIEKFTDQLREVIHLVDELGKVETKNIEPTSQTTEIVNSFRRDEIEVSQTFSQEEALSGTKSGVNGFFGVPQILHKDDEN